MTLKFYDDGTGNSYTAMGVPSQLITSNVTSSSADLTLPSAVTGAQHYELSESADGGSTWTVVDSAIAPASIVSPATYSRSGLTSGATYQWRLRAKFASLVSPLYSAVRSVVTTVLPVVDANFAAGDTVATSAYPNRASTFHTNSIGFAWNAPGVSTSVEPHPESGRNSLVFSFSASPSPTPDSAVAWSEQRFEINNQYFEVYTQYDLYIPTNFKIRNLKVIPVDSGQNISAWAVGDTVVGGSGANGTVWGVNGQTLYVLNPTYAIYKGGYWSGVTLQNTTQSLSATVAASTNAYVFGPNNKFHTLWSGTYSSQPPPASGGVLGLEYEANQTPSIGGEYDNPYGTVKSTATDTNGQTANEVSAITPSAPIIDVVNDLGKTHTYTFRWKRSSGPSANDGAMEVWKNGILVYSRSDFPNYDSTKNYFERGYLLGYANTGFDVLTKLGIERFRLYTTRPPGLQ